MRAAEPDYFLNVPQLLERMRKGVDEQLWKTGGIPRAIYGQAKAAYVRQREGKKSISDFFWLGFANAIIFPAIRKKMIGSKLKALICGSAPLNLETQLFFMMIGIPVLQVYGLTETGAICSARFLRMTFEKAAPAPPNAIPIPPQNASKPLKLNKRAQMSATPPSATRLPASPETANRIPPSRAAARSDARAC